MNTVTLPENRREVIRRTGLNLGIDQISNGSYLHTLVDGLYEHNSKVTEEINSTIKELSLETASMSTLESYGAKKGVPKMKSRLLASNSGDMVVFLRPSFYKDVSDLTLKLFSKNQILKSDIFIITILEDVTYNSSSDRVYISCSIAINDIYELPFDYIEKGKVLRLSVPQQFKDFMEDLVLEVERNVSFSSYTESDSAYKQRLLQAMQETNISGEAYVLSILNSMPYVDQYYVEDSSYPTNIYLLNNLMYTSEQYEELLDEATLALGTSLINDVKTYGSNFDLKAAEKISISLNISIDSGVSNAGAYLINIEDYIRSKHVLGEEFTLNKDFIDLFLRSNGEFDTKFNLEISLYYNGISILNEDKESLTLTEKQYPFLSQLIYNGVDMYDI